MISLDGLTPAVLTEIVVICMGSLANIPKFLDNYLLLIGFQWPPRYTTIYLGAFLDMEVTKCYYDYEYGDFAWENKRRLLDYHVK